MASDWQMKGEYLKTCSCAPGCPCDFWSPPTQGLCEGFNAMRIKEGHFDSVSLNGVIWAISFHFPAALHLGNGTVQPYIDERSTDAQRNAILTILSGKAGGPWFEVVASVVSKVLTPRFVPIKFEFDMKKRSGRCTIAGEIEVITEAIKDINNNDVRAQICMPEGIEYFTAEIAASKVLKSTGAIPFNRTNTHSGFSEVEYTPTGLKR
ncbi:MAG: DUF1326 domain-containing protein [Tepidisphaeraceae bacterium]